MGQPLAWLPACQGRLRCLLRPASWRCPEPVDRASGIGSSHGRASLPRGLTFRANLSWTFVGNVFYAGCQWGILILLAKVGSPEEVGQFSLGLAVTAPIIMLANLQLRAVQATDASCEYRFGDYLGLRLVMATVAMLAIACVVALSGYSTDTALVVLVLGLAKASESVSDIVFGLLQRNERMDRIAVSQLMRGCLSLVVLGVLVRATDSVLWGLLGMAASWLAVLLLYDIHNARRLTIARPRFDRRVLWQLGWVSLPLGVVMMLISLNSNIPRYFLQEYWGERYLGYFSAMAYIIVAGSTVVGAVGQVATPRLAAYYAVGDAVAFRRLLIRVAAVAAGLGAAGVLIACLFGRHVLTLLYRADYSEYSGVLVWLAIAAAVGYVGSALGYGITATRRFGSFLVPYLIVTVVVLICCRLWIPRLGLLGAAYATLVKGVAMLVAPLLILRMSQEDEQ